MLLSRSGILAETINMVITSQSCLLKIQSTRLVIFWIFVALPWIFSALFLIFSTLILIFFATNFDLFWQEIDFFCIKLNFFGTKLEVLGTKLKIFGTKWKCFDTKLKFFGCPYEPPWNREYSGSFQNKSVSSTNKHYRALSSMINLWRDSRTCEKYRILLSVMPRSNNSLKFSRESVLGNMLLSH